MRVVGVTGRLGSGKSSLCGLIERRGRVAVIDADKIGHEILEERSPIRERLVSRFGDRILDPRGEIDRRSLASIVFEEQGALDDLNGIVHPVLVQRILERLRALRESGGIDIVLIDAALLLEWADRLALDRVIWVRTSKETAIRRMAERGMDEDEVQRRLERQRSEAEFRARADRIVENDGSRSDLDHEAERLWAWLRAQPA